MLCVNVLTEGVTGQMGVALSIQSRRETPEGVAIGVVCNLRRSRNSRSDRSCQSPDRRHEVRMVEETCLGG